MKKEEVVRYRLIKFLLAIFIFSSGSVFDGELSAKDTKEKSKQLVGVFKVLDGSTLSLDGNAYKLFGIRGPTSNQKCKKGALPWLCGAAARRFLLEKVNGDILNCGLISATEIKCFLKGRDLSVSVIAAGWAVSNVSDTKYKEAEANARKNGLGLWPKLP